MPGNNNNNNDAAAAVVVDSPGALAALVGSRPKAILGFFAPWQRGSMALVGSVAAGMGREGLLLPQEGAVVVRLCSCMHACMHGFARVLPTVSHPPHAWLPVFPINTSTHN